MQNQSAPKTRRAQDEPELTRRARAGDPAAFEAIMRTNNRLLYRLVRPLVVNDADAEDIVQETYVRAFNNIASFQGQARIGTWLARIAMNEVINRQRKTRMTESLESSENVISLRAHTGPDISMVPVLETPEQATGREEIRRYLEAAIEQLPEEFRAVFVLRGIEEFSTEETADILGIRTETVKTRYFRARQGLREILDADVQAALRETHPFAGRRCNHIVRNVFKRLGIAID